MKNTVIQIKSVVDNYGWIPYHCCLCLSWAVVFSWCGSVFWSTATVYRLLTHFPAPVFPERVLNRALDRNFRSPSSAFICFQLSFVLSPVVVGSVLTFPCLVSEYESIEQRLAYGSAVPSPFSPSSHSFKLPPSVLSSLSLYPFSPPPSFRTLPLPLSRMAFLTPFSTASLTSLFSTRKAIGHFIIPSHSRVRNLHSFVTPVFPLALTLTLLSTDSLIPGLSLNLWVCVQKGRN